MLPHNTDEILFHRGQIQDRVVELVDEMAGQVHGENLVLIGILRGSFMFCADLVREIDRHNLHPRIDFTIMESYGAGTESSGIVKVMKDISVDISDADVVLIDDILDTGRTMSYAVNLVREKGARSVQSCVLLDKPSRRVIPFTADYVGFTIDDHFVVGYGLDYDSYYRELPHIAKVAFT